MNWTLLRIPAFRSLWSGRLLSWVGNGIGPVALAFAALDLGAGPVGLGIVVACRSVPNIALVLFGGAVTDRLPKRAVALAASILSAISLAAAAVLSATGAATLPLLGAAAAVGGAGAALFVPSTGAILRELVGESLIRDATVLNRVAMNIGLVVGTALGGGLVGAFSPEIALAAASLLFTCAVVAFSGLPRGAVGAIRDVAFMTDLRTGLEFVRRSPWLLAGLGLSFVAQFSFAGGVQVLGPIAADDSFGRTLWGFAGAVQTLGLVVGAVLAGQLRGRLRLAVATTGVAAIALPLLVLALVFAVAPGVVDPLHSFFWLTLALFVAGAGIELFAIPLDVAIQLQVPRTHLGRVYATLTLATLLGMPVGELLVGPIARRLGDSPTLLALAAFTVASSAAVAASPRVRGADRAAR